MATDPKKAQEAASNPWETTLPDGSLITANYYDAMRSSAFKNDSLAGDYIEMVKAERASQGSDLWFVTKYTMQNIDDAEKGIFLSEPQFAEKDRPQAVPFMDALAAIGQYELMGEKQPFMKDAEIEKNYSAEHPVFKLFYFDVEQFKKAANIEGIVFDESNIPHRRVGGSIIGSAAFRIADLTAALTAADDADPALKGRIENGVLSDMFNAVSGKEANFDVFLKVADTLAITDEFATDLGGFYLGLQNVISGSNDLAKVDGFNTADQRKAFEKAAKNSFNNLDYNGFRGLYSALEQLSGKVEEIAEKGVYVEPFEKFVKELEIYTYMLEATVKKDELNKQMQNVNGIDRQAIIDINTGVSNAIEKFKELGGPQTRIDELKGWAMSRNAPRIPDFIPGFLTRYYGKREQIMAKIENRDTSATQDVTVMGAEIKPSLDQETVKKKKKPSND